MAPRPRPGHPDLHVKALEGIVSANTFFTAAVFIGITGTPTPSPGIPTNCIPGGDIARSLFLFEVLSLGFYLLSSLVAQGMKLAVTLLTTDEYYEDAKAAEQSSDIEEQPAWRVIGRRERRRAVLRFARPMMLLAAASSVMGSFFLLLSMVDLIQLKFGLLSCNIPMAVGAAMALSVLVVAGLLFYASTVVYTLSNY